MKKFFSLLTLALLTTSAWAANTYVKVTSADQLVAGQKYILVNEDANKGMGALSTTSTKYGLAVDINIASGVVDIDGTDVVELTLGGATGDWTFDMGGNSSYMTWTSGNSLNATNNTTGDFSAKEKWTASVTDNGVELKNNADATRVLQYNASNPRFACYTSAQKPAVLYVQNAGAVVPVTVAAPTLPAATTFNDSYTVEITNNEPGSTLYYSTDGLAWTEGNSVTITETTKVYAKATKDGVDSRIVSETYTKVLPAIDPIGNTYVKVTDMSMLAAGDQIIIVNSGVAGDAQAMGARNSNGNNFLTTGVTVGDDLKITTEGAQVLVLEAAGDNWYLKTLDNQYLYAASSTSNHLKLEAVADSNAIASISIADSAIVVFQGKYTHNIMRYNYNNGTPMFSCYLPEKMDAIYIYKATGEEASFVAAPTLPASCEFEQSMTVEITNNEEGATLMYALNDGEFTEYTQALNITETTTVHAKAVKGENESAVVSATYTLKPAATTVATIAEGNKLADDTEFTFTGNAVVCFKNKKNMWVRDESGSVQLYGSDNFGDEFQKGVVITPNWGAKKATYNGMHEYTNLTNLTASQQTVTVEPYERETLTMENANEYVVLKNVTIVSQSTSGGRTNYTTNTGIVARNNFGVAFDPQEGVAYNLIGVVSAYNGNPQLYITEVEGYVAPIATPNDLAEANALTDNMQFTYSNDVAATYQNGKYLFIRDENGNSGLIFGEIDATFETGDVLGADWSATKTTYYGVREFIDATGVTNSGEEWEVAPYERKTLTVDNVNEYVIMKGLSVIPETDETVSHYSQKYYNVADSMMIYDQFGVNPTFVEGKTYDIVGIATIYNNKPQLYIISVTEVAVDVLRGDVDNSGDVTISDVTALIDALLSGNIQNINDGAADTNLDGEVSIGDVTVLIDFLLSGNWHE